jgi:hypothetical protein
MTYTKGNIIVEQIKIGDIHYEYGMDLGIKCKVITTPTLNEQGNWVWKSENVNNGNKIEYLVNPIYPHYGPNLYDYEAYEVKYYL